MIVDKHGYDNLEETIARLTHALGERQDKSQEDRNKMAVSIEDLAMRQTVMESGFTHLQADISRGAKASEEMSRDIKDMLAKMQRDQIESAGRIEQFRQLREDIYGPPHPGIMQRIDNMENARSKITGVIIGVMFVAGIIGGIVQALILEYIKHV